jgi:hypothetical protein
MSSSIPRRAYSDKWTLAEKAIQDAVWEVERAGADPLLTKAVNLLGAAKDAVSDYVDNIQANPFSQHFPVQLPENERKIMKTNENEKTLTIDGISQMVEQAQASLTLSPALQMEDISHLVNCSLFQETQESLEARKVENAQGRGYMVRFIGVKAPTFNLGAGAKKLAELLNEVCGAYQVVGHLQMPVSIPLHVDSTTPESLYVCYVAFTPEAARALDELTKLKTGPSFIEGMGNLD